jgi:hypothetical protein
MNNDIVVAETLAHIEEEHHNTDEQLASLNQAIIPDAPKEHQPIILWGFLPTWKNRFTKQSLSQRKTRRRNNKRARSRRKGGRSR